MTGTFGGGSSFPKLDVDVVGDPEAGRGVIYLHGAEGDKAQLRELGDRVDAGWSMYPSLRGHGASFRPDWGYSPLEFAADLQRLAPLMPPQLHFVGYSFGALVGAISAVTWASARTASLTVIDTSFDAYPERHLEDEWAEGSYLRWMFDYRAALPRSSRVVVIRAQASSVLPPAEAARLANYPAVEIVEVAGDHASVLAGTERLADVIREKVIRGDLIP